MGQEVYNGIQNNQKWLAGYWRQALLAFSPHSGTKSLRQNVGVNEDYRLGVGTWRVYWSSVIVSLCTGPLFSISCHVPQQGPMVRHWQWSRQLLRLFRCHNGSEVGKMVSLEKCNVKLVRWTFFYCSWLFKHIYHKDAQRASNSQCTIWRNESVRYQSFAYATTVVSRGIPICPA